MGLGRPKHGGREAFEEAALVHLDALYALALRLTRDVQDAQDLVQDAMVRAFRFYDRFEAGSNMRAWLFKILTNAFYNRLRKQGNIRRLELESVAGDHYDQFISSASMASRNAEESLLSKLSGEDIRRAVDELPDEFRLPVLLCDVHGFSYKEIADILACPVGTVMSRLYRGRRRLQGQLYEYAVDQGLVRVTSSESMSSNTADLAEYRRRRGDR